MNEQTNQWLALLKRRVVGAAGYSIQGLKACFRHEEAFRVQVYLTAVLVPIAMLLADTAVEFILLTGAVMLVLIVELLNSAIEAAVDRMGKGHHELAGRAKDIGSAAVFLSMMMFLVTWFSLCLN